MKKIITIAGLLVSIVGHSQIPTPSQAWGNSFKRLFITQADTATTKLAGGLQIISGVLYVADGTKWAATGGGTGNLRFANNVVVNGGTGTTLGVWNNGEIIPLANKLFDSLPYILATKCNAPSYVYPVIGISGSPSDGSYEIGTNLGTITLSSSYTQNNGGAATGTTYFQNSTALGGNTATISSLTTTQQFYVNKTYGQGACIANNCGAIDCNGRVTAGNGSSSPIYYTPFSKRYYGFSTSSSPSNATILALSQDNNGTTASLTLSNVTPIGSQYLVYITNGTVTSVVVNGIPATSAFTITTYGVTNAQGYVSTYSYIYSNNQQTSTLNSVIFN